MEFLPIKTRVVNPPKDEIWDILDTLEIRDKDIIFITSKILAIHQGRCVPMTDISKQDLIQREATHYLPYKKEGGTIFNLTITDNTLIVAAGIDESNANGHYILWPTEIDKLCMEIHKYLIKKHKIENLGIVATDSHTVPLRRGVTGFAIGLAGVKPLYDIRGTQDIFGREMHVTQIDKIDPLAGMAVLLMGEAAETTPITILRGFSGLGFDENAGMDDFKISPRFDIYEPLLRAFYDKN